MLGLTVPGFAPIRPNVLATKRVTGGTFSPNGFPKRNGGAFNEKTREPLGKVCLRRPRRSETPDDGRCHIRRWVEGLVPFTEGGVQIPPPTPETPPCRRPGGASVAGTVSRFAENWCATLLTVR
jgi:hypothetical protein